ELFKIDNGLLPVDPIVTFAPRLPNAVKKYGYDQGKLLAENYAKIGGYKFKTLFRRKMIPRQTQQKLLNYRQRAANVKGAFAICDVEQIYGRNVILIDDVVTSGATLGECISLLYENGAKTVICRSIAHTYRKNKRKND
ncbi:MAG: ComF family protein, partial [Clostridia bacterium]|nr:ComF family protein [Clostridia bacterium]